jgi:hypothetical protein
MLQSFMSQVESGVPWYRDLRHAKETEQTARAPESWRGRGDELVLQHEQLGRHQGLLWGPTGTPMELSLVAFIIDKHVGTSGSIMMLPCKLFRENAYTAG